MLSRRKGGFFVGYQTTFTLMFSTIADAANFETDLIPFFTPNHIKPRRVCSHFSTIREFMKDDGQQFAYSKFIAPASGSTRFAKALDRKTTGSINELILSADHVLADGDVSPHEVGFKINEVLLSALASEGFGGYGQPRDAFLKLVP